MKEYLYLLYYGNYYRVWMTERMVRKSFNPILRFVIKNIPYIVPHIKRNLAKQNLTPVKYADNVININNKISDANIAHTFEWLIQIHLVFFYIIALLDLLLILRYIFGHYWCGVCIGRENVVAIGWIIIILATVCMYLTCGIVGTDKNEKKFRRQSKKEQRKALWVYLGSFAFVLILFFLLWGHKIFGL